MKLTPRQVQCRTLFEAAGFPRSGASALVGNFSIESGPSLPTAFRTRDLDHGSNGLAQWRLGRLANYRNYVRQRKPELIEQGMDEAAVEKAMWPWYGRMDYQVQFVCRELAVDYPLLNAKLRKGGDAAALCADVCWQYERPNKALSHIADRIAYAKALSVTTGASDTQVGVVDHLAAAARTHDRQVNAGGVVAMVGGVGATGVVLSALAPTLSTWEWVAVAVGAVLVIGGSVVALLSERHAEAIRRAARGVTPDAPPAERVLVTPVMPTPAPPPVVPGVDWSTMPHTSGLATQVGSVVPLTQTAPNPNFAMPATTTLTGQAAVAEALAQTMSQGGATMTIQHGPGAP